MDPDKALAELRNIADALTDRSPDMSLMDVTDMADDMAARFIALDEWLRNGGFIPRAWRPF